MKIVFALFLLLATHSILPGDPEGWIPVEAPIFKAGSTTDCLQFREAWVVSKQHDVIAIQRGDFALSLGFSNIPVLPDALQRLIPHLITLENEKTNRLARRAGFLNRTASHFIPGADPHDKFRGFPFADGWITGTDHGEFGGAVFWMDANAHRLKFLYGDNLFSLLPTRTGMLVLTGGRHLIGHGNAVFLTPANLAPGGSLPQLTNLGEAPIAAAQIRDDILAGFLILTDNGFRRLQADSDTGYLLSFSIVTLQPQFAMLGANSFAMQKDGKIIIGFVDHLLVMSGAWEMDNPWTEPFTSQWYIHSSCVNRVKQGDECVCVPATAEELRRAIQLP